MKKKNHIKVRFSTLLLCFLAIVLYAAPALHADETVPANETCYIDDLVDGVLRVEFKGTANLLTGASVTKSIYVLTGGTLNMYSGTVGWFISVSSDASMTVYGTGFKVDGETCDYGEVILTGGIGTLTGDYEDGSQIKLVILSDIDVPIKLQPPPRITIDIKPGSELNSINLKSKGVVPVAVFTTEDFDASTINPTTVKFAGAGPIRWKICHVDEDDDLDMLFHFKTKELNLDADSTEATLTGTTFGGDAIAGTDTVRIVQSKKE